MCVTQASALNGLVYGTMLIITDTPEQKRLLESNPSKYYEFRIGLEKKLAAGFPGLWKGTKSQARFTSLSQTFMKTKITDKQLLDDLLPEFEAGCRRFTPGGHYLDALQKPNAEYIKDSISMVTEDSLITSSGKKIACDVIVYATGFEPYQPRFPVIGRAGQSLSKDWDREGPCESYMSAMVAGFPNLFGEQDLPRSVSSLQPNCDVCSLQPAYLPRQRVCRARYRTGRELYGTRVIPSTN